MIHLHKSLAVDFRLIFKKLLAPCFIFRDNLSKKSLVLSHSEPDKTKMTLLLYDDHQFVTEAMADFLRANASSIDAIHQCHSVESFINTIQKNKPDVVISDVLSDENAGFRIFEYCAKNFPTTSVFAFSSVSNPFIINELKNLGVIEVVNKKDGFGKLWETVLEKLATPRIKNRRVNQAELTQTEKEIVAHLINGLSAKEIAQLKGSSINTINNQKSRLLEKFGCNSTTDLIIKLSQLGLINVL